jgi:uncharacterized membrane protein YhaH (DUF805 family)
MKYFFEALKKYAVFTGRARRSEYWYFTLFNIIISFVVGAIAGATNTPLLGTAYTLALLLPGIAVGVRRMHDTGKSGWYVLIPIYNLILACTEGTPGRNEYGPDPKRPEMEDEINEIGSHLENN